MLDTEVHGNQGATVAEWSKALFVKENGLKPKDSKFAPGLGNL